MENIEGLTVTHQKTDIIQRSMTLTHGRTKTQLNNILEQINSLKGDHIIKIDLLVVHQNARKVWARMDNEMIECRKRSRFTANYQTMYEEIQVMLKLIEKEVFWQKLH